MQSLPSSHPIHASQSFKDLITGMPFLAEKVTLDAITKPLERFDDYTGLGWAIPECTYPADAEEKIISNMNRLRELIYRAESYQIEDPIEEFELDGEKGRFLIVYPSGQFLSYPLYTGQFTLLLDKQRQTISTLTATGNFLSTIAESSCFPDFGGDLVKPALLGEMAANSKTIGKVFEGTGNQSCNLIAGCVGLQQWETVLQPYQNLPDYSSRIELIKLISSNWLETDAINTNIDGTAFDIAQLHDGR